MRVNSGSKSGFGLAEGMDLTAASSSPGALSGFFLTGAGMGLKRRVRSKVRNEISSGLEASRQIPCGDESFQTGCRGQQQ